MVSKLHPATDEIGATTFVIAVRNDDHHEPITTWLSPTCERLRRIGNEWLGEVSGRRYRLHDLD